MPFAYCPWCNRSMTLGYDPTGLELRCTSCGKLFRVQKEGHDVPDIRRPDSARRSDDDRDDDDFDRRYDRDYDDDYDDAPRRRRRPPRVPPRPLFDEQERADMHPPEGQSAGNAARVFFVVSAAIAGLQLLVLIGLGAQSLDWQTRPDPQLIYDITSTISLVSAVGSIAAWALFLIWIYQAYRNLVRMHVPDLASPRTVVLWFFVPFANLIVPPLRIHDLARASRPASTRTAHEDWKRSLGIGSIAAWWILNVLAGLLSIFGGVFQPEWQRVRNAFVLGIMLFVLSRILAIVANVLGNSIVGNIIDQQRRKWNGICGKTDRYDRDAYDRDDRDRY